MEPIWIALIVAISTTTSPLLLAYLTNRNRRAEKQEDYARQDAVAAQAAEAAALLLKANERMAATAKVTNQKLDVIHTLVNSNMTAAMQAELDARAAQLASLIELVDLKKTAGKEPSVEALAAIEVLKGKIAELQAGLADRLKQTAPVEQQQR